MGRMMWERECCLPAPWITNFDQCTRVNAIRIITCHLNRRRLNVMFVFIERFQSNSILEVLCQEGRGFWVYFTVIKSVGIHLVITFIVEID